MMRSYPVPHTLATGIRSASLRMPSIKLLASGDSPAAEWAGRIVSAECNAIAEALVACGCEAEASHYGILDPDSDEPLVIAVVSLNDTGMLRRWNGSGWDQVPDEMDPVGYQFVELDDSMLADALRATTAGGMLLRATDPKAKTSGVLVAAPSEGKHFAIVDDFDTTAVLDLFEVRPGPVTLVRRNGVWVEDTKILGRLRSVDPPRVVQIAPDDVAAVAAQVDEYDRAHPSDDAITASIWDESKHKRSETGQFAKKDGGGANGRPSMNAEQLREYIKTGKLPSDVKLATSLRKSAEAKKMTVGGQEIKKGKGGKGGKGGGGGGKGAKARAKKRGSGGAGGGSAAAKKTAAAAKTAASKKAAAAKKVAAAKAKKKADAVKRAKAQLASKWAAEDAAAKAKDSAYDIARAKSDLAENQRRDAANDALKAEQTALAEKLRTGRPKMTGRPEDDAIQRAYDVQARKEAEAFTAKANAELDRRKKYDQAASYEKASEKIRRMERKAATDARRSIERKRIDAMVNGTPTGSKARAKRKPVKRTWKPPVRAAGVPEHSTMPRKLKDYWVRGKGAALIRWGTGGDFNRCRRQLSKYLNPAQVPGACANLHKAATGTWPGKNRGHGVTASASAPTHTGVAVAAKDSGRILLLQRSNKDESDPARGTWEFPGGSIEDGELPLEAARREWSEETGAEFPAGAEHVGSWDSPDGVYRGYVVVVPSEDDVHINTDPEDRDVLNPDDPDGDDIETAAWFDPEHLPDNPALRPEVLDTDWDLFKPEALTAAGYVGNGAMVALEIDPALAAELAANVVDGNPPEEMHVTLAYLGENVDPAVLDVAAQIVEAAALEYNALEANLSGRGQFINPGGQANYVSVDAPGIEAFWADLTDRLHRAGVTLPIEHGFAPHVTLKYGDIAEQEWPALPRETMLGRIKVCSGSTDLGAWDMLP